MEARHTIELTTVGRGPVGPIGPVERETVGRAVELTKGRFPTETDTTTLGSTEAMLLRALVGSVGTGREMGTEAVAKGIKAVYRCTRQISSSSEKLHLKDCISTHNIGKNGAQNASDIGGYCSGACRQKGGLESELSVKTYLKPRDQRTYDFRD